PPITQISLSLCNLRNLWNLLNQFPDLAPGDEFDVVFLKDFTKGIAGEEFEVALAPGCAPVRMIGCCGTHFGVVVGEVNYDFRYAGLEFLECVSVKLRPVLRRDS